LKLQLIVRRAPISSAANWLKQSWQIFQTNPGLFVGMHAVIMLLSLAVLIPVVGMLVLFAVPFLQAGFFTAIVASQQQKPLQFEMLFKPFQIAEIRTPILMMAVAQLLCSLPHLVLVEQFTESFKAGHVEIVEVLAIVVLYSLNLMLFAYAVPIIYFLRENRLWPVLQSSLLACWRNTLPLLLFVLMIMGILVLVSVVISLLSSIVSFATVLFLPAMFVLMPILTIAFFLSFSEFFALVISKDEPTQVFEV